MESVQRRATAWILKSKRGEIPYKQRLTTLSLLPLFKALYGNIDLDVRAFVLFVNNGRIRLSQNPTLTLKTPYCKSSTFQASYFNRIVKLWNYNQFQNYRDRSLYYGKCSKHFNPPGPHFNVVFYLPSNLMNQSVSTYNSTLIGEGGGEGREYMDNNIYI